MSECSFMKQDVSRTGTAEICVKHGRERVYCEKAKLERELEEVKNASVAIDAERNDAHRLVEEAERERDELHNGLVKVLATRAQFDAEDPETLPHYVEKILDERDALKKKVVAAESNAKCGWETAKASDKSRTKAEEKFKRQVKLIDIKARVGIYEGMVGEMKAAGASGVSIEKVQGWAHIARKDMLDLEDSLPKKP